MRDRAVTTQSCYVVIIVANAVVKVSTEPFNVPNGAHRPKFLTGAFIESRGCLDVTSLGNYTNAFYPAMTADSAGLAGNLSRNPACLRALSMFCMPVHEFT